MDYKKLLINELEKKEILRQYGLLNEDSKKAENLLNKSDVRFVFEGGYHSEKAINDEIKKTMNALVSEIYSVIKNKPGGVFLTNVVLNSGESKIPNTDAEKGGIRVEPKYLARKRMATMKKFITDALAKIKLPTPKITINEPSEGKTPFVNNKSGFCPQSKLSPSDPQGYACLDKLFNPGEGIVNWNNGRTSVYSEVLNAYKKEQFISASISVYDVSNMKKCLTGLSFQINYEGRNGEKHSCNNAVYEIMAGEVILPRDDGKLYASLDNKDSKFDNSPQSNCAKSPDGVTIVDSSKDKRCYRYNTFKITDELATKIITSSSIVNNSSNILITAKCLSAPNESWKYGCHEGAGTIRINSNDGTSKVLDITTPTKQNMRTPLFAFNSCDVNNITVYGANGMPIPKDDKT